MEVESKMKESVEMLSAIHEVADELRLLRHFLEFKHGLMVKPCMRPCANTTSATSC